MWKQRVIAAALLVGLWWPAACARQARGQQAWQVRFGPVISNEVIVGRVIDGSTVWIMTGSNAIVRVDLQNGSSVRSEVEELTGDEHVWGLAKAEGELWTLLGRTLLARIDSGGRVNQRIPLTDPHIGIFGGGEELLYQVMNFEPPAGALTIGPPGEERRRPWSGIRTRPLALARTAAAALNLVSCGPTFAQSIPCWFPDQSIVTLTSNGGESRDLALEGLPGDVPEVLLASENPRRPIRDALVDAGGDLWVLGSGDPAPSAQSGAPGGWLIARYDAHGRTKRRMRLPKPGRLLLGAAGDSCLIVASDGRVVEVRP
jgi:hypothetical protein